jgi:DNA-binding transcriptional MerR regulator
MPEDHASPSAPGTAADPEATYTLDDLTAQAGVTVRTVRYYIGEGLLPPPTGAGPGTRYTREHLDRLLLIGALKDRYLPLKEIRRRLRGMDAAGVHAAVEGMHRRAEGEQPRLAEPDVASSTLLMADAPGPEPSSASSYIDALLREEPRERRHRTPPGAPRPPAPERGEIRFPGATEFPPDMFPIPADLGERRWRKLAITPEAELAIEDELYQRRREQIDALIAHIRRVLTSS